MAKSKGFQRRQKRSLAELRGTIWKKGSTKAIGYYINYRKGDGASREFHLRNLKTGKVYQFGGPATAKLAKWVHTGEKYSAFKKK